MKFKKLKLFTAELEPELKFYSQTLGFELLERTKTSFSVKVGWSELTFEESEEDHLYHYCFLIPSNQLDLALEWMERRVEIIDIENGRKTQNFASWNADSFYFHDASGNIAEFIARHDLENDDMGDFDISKVLGVNEMGMPTRDVGKLNQQLEDELGTKFWRGDPERFGTNGSQEGIWLLPNYELKEIWFPTSLKIKPQPFEALVENRGREFRIEYRNEQLKTRTNEA